LILNLKLFWTLLTSEAVLLLGLWARRKSTL